MDNEFVTLNVYLGSGAKTSVVVATDEEPEAVAEKLAEQITEVGKPHWLLIENLLIFTGAVSAIEVV